LREQHLHREVISISEFNYPFWVSGQQVGLVREPWTVQAPVAPITYLREHMVIAMSGQPVTMEPASDDLNPASTSENNLDPAALSESSKTTITAAKGTDTAAAPATTATDATRAPAATSSSSSYADVTPKQSPAVSTPKSFGSPGLGGSAGKPKFTKLNLSNRIKDLAPAPGTLTLQKVSMKGVEGGAAGGRLTVLSGSKKPSSSTLASVTTPTAATATEATEGQQPSAEEGKQPQPGESQAPAAPPQAVAPGSSPHAAVAASVAARGWGSKVAKPQPLGTAEQEEAERGKGAKQASSQAWGRTAATTPRDSRSSSHAEPTVTDEFGPTLAVAVASGLIPAAIVEPPQGHLADPYAAEQPQPQAGVGAGAIAGTKVMQPSPTVGLDGSLRPLGAMRDQGLGSGSGSGSGALTLEERAAAAGSSRPQQM
ncbi:unnamed protein product, partial [Chrysoparadoxa australica]